MRSGGNGSRALVREMQGERIGESERGCGVG